jgi:hypothetical protein
MKHSLALIIAVILLTTASIACNVFDSGGDVYYPSSRSYQGHEGDLDMDNFVHANPKVVATRLDDCQTCHTGGDVDYGGGDIESLNPCSFCHLITFPDPDIQSGAPTAYVQTLNPYGLDYRSHGRSVQALNQIRNLDSDKDSHSNISEIDGLRYPGDPTSMPGQQTIPIYTFTRAALQALSAHTQLTLMNAQKQEFDDYAVYTGVKIKDLLEAAGVDLANATGITVVAPDGFAKDFSISDINSAYPPSLWFGNLAPSDFPDADQGFVSYPPDSLLPPGLTEGGQIPGEQWLMIAYLRDAEAMVPSILDPESGKIDGEGPFRLVVPQSEPGSPDRGSNYSPTGYNDGWDYDPDKDHNAGLCVRGAVAIRVNPMPSGYEEFDWKYGGWALIDASELIIYGSGVPGN